MIAALLFHRKRGFGRRACAGAGVGGVFRLFVVDAVLRAILPAHPNWLAGAAFRAIAALCLHRLALDGALPMRRHAGDTATVLLAIAVAALLTLPGRSPALWEIVS